MDPGEGTPPEVNSFYPDDEHPLKSPDSGKKRKLQYEQLGLPLSKHKFRERCSSSVQGSPIAAHPETEGTWEGSPNFCVVNRELAYLPDPSGGSSDGSNSLVAGDDSSTTSTLDADGQPEMSSEKLVFPWEPSTSSCRPDVISFRNNLYSWESRIVKKPDPRELNMSVQEGHGDSEDEIQEEAGYRASDEQLPSFGMYEDYIEECPDAAIEEFMLYSNDVAPNTFAHPSGRWGFKRDAALGTGKPTIDQEFEQYFSMLML